MKKVLICLVFLSFFSCTNNNNSNEHYKIRISYTYSFDKIAPGRIGRIKVRLPQDYTGRQEVHKISYSVRPNKLLIENNDPIAYFIVKPNSKPIKIDVVMTMFRYHFFNASIHKDDDDPSDYLSYDTNEKLVNIARSFKDDDPVKTIDNILIDIITTIRYKIQDSENNALFAIENGEGDCTEFSDLFVTMCRINNIPARHIMGYMNKVNNTFAGYNNHAWAEVYLKEKGWVPVETIGDTSLLKLFPTRLPNSFIYLNKTDDISYFVSSTKNLNLKENIKISTIK